MYRRVWLSPSSLAQLLQVAVNLAKALGVTVNQLPLHFVVSWFEQKVPASPLAVVPCVRVRPFS